MKKIYLLSLLSIFSLNLFCQIHWTKYPDNPVMVQGPSGEWDDQEIEPGSVIYYDNIYHMWYTGSKHLDPYRIGYATSPDGITWAKDTNNPVLDVGQDGDWDDNHIYVDQVLVIDSIFHMWYTGQNDYNRDYCIGHATSPDGVTWTKDTNNPVLKKGDVEEWDDVSVYASSVIYDGNEYHMWYGGWNSTEGQVGHATSPDGVNWTKDSLNPVLTCEAEKWDYPSVIPTTVLFDSNTYHMWYHANQQIGYATSADGVTWEKDKNNPVLKKGPTGSWDNFEISSAEVIDSSGIKFKMWYRGDQNSITVSIGYAESMVPAWKQMKSMDIARGGAVSCVIDSMIYVFGGTDRFIFTLDSTDAYNTKTDKWSDLATMAEDIFGGNAEVTNNKIYLAGGWRHVNNDWFTTNSTMEYDPEGNTWQEKTGSPEKNGGNASCVLNDTIYVLGGTEDPDTLDRKKAWYYAPLMDSWGSLPDMIYDRPGGSSAAVLDNKIYVLGGTYESEWDNPTGKSEVYDPKLKTWTELADMPVPVVGHISVVHDNRILVFGGDSVHTTSGAGYGRSIGTNIIQAYDPSTDSWERMHGIPFKRTAMAGEKVGNYVYLIGGHLNGRDLNDPLSEVWRFDLGDLKPFTYATGVSLDKDTLSIGVGSSEELVPKVDPADASDPTVSWTSAKPFIATVTDGTVKGVNVGETYIYVTTNDGHYKDSCLVTVIPTGINNAEATGFKLYPNPASDLINLEFNSPGTHVVRLTTLNGQLMYNKSMEGNSHQIDLSSFHKGVYLITVTSKDYVITKKIIKMQ